MYKLRAFHLGHGVKFCRNILWAHRGTATHFGHRGQQGVYIHRIVLFLNPIYTSHFACHKHCGCAILHIIRLACYYYRHRQMRRHYIAPALQLYSLRKAARGRLRERTLAAYRSYSSSAFSEETWSRLTISLPPASVKFPCHPWSMPEASC